MSQQKITGYTIVILILLAIYYVFTRGLLNASGGADVAQSGVGGQTATVQSGIVGGQQNAPTTTTWPCSSCGAGSPMAIVASQPPIFSGGGVLSS